MVKVLFLDNAQDLQNYRSILSGISSKSPYYTVEYFEVFASGLKNLICFYWDKNGAYILMPGYIRDIEGHDDMKDFTSPYGYSGPLFSENIDQKSLHLFWQEVETWLINNDIISVFIRFSLNENYYGFPGEVKITLANIKGKILPDDEQWRGFNRKVRKNVEKAKREGLIVKILWGYDLTEDLLEKFQTIYIHTLSRSNAEDFFYYSKDDIRKFVSTNGDLCVFAFALDGSEVVSAEMVLLSEDCMFSFLGGTHEQSFYKRPGDLLKFELICWARDKKFSYFVLGGGYGSNDGIFNFKRAFFPKDIVNYMTGRQVLNDEKYSFLVDEFLSKALNLNSKLEQVYQLDFFPEYRKSL